ncbi:MAG: CheR family methyltransferase [Anaerolineae bacterium]
MPISEQQLKQAIDLIESRLGLSATTLRRIGLGDLLEQISGGEAMHLLQTLRASDEHSIIWQRLIHALTIGETYFLRDKEHFRILREIILPRLILERRQQNDLRLTIWCLGCSTGEEAYSVATTLYEVLPDLHKWRINLVATDINQHAIKLAKQGIYRDWSFRQTPDHYQQRYFTRVDDGWQIALHIRNMVSFMRMNALSGMPIPQSDIIFARHILMYLNPDHALQIERTLYQALVHHGWLILGQAEALRSSREGWRLHMFPSSPIYQKLNPDETAPQSVSYPIHPELIHNGNHDDHERYQQAVEALHHDQPDEAEQSLSAVLDDHPDHTRAHIMLAAIFANRQLYPEALTHLETALAKSRLYADAHYVKGLILLEQNQTENALQSFSAALYCNRKHALAALMLGNLYHHQGDSVQAVRHWRNALDAIINLDEEAFVSDISDMTVARLRGMIQQQQNLMKKGGSRSQI